MKRESRKFTLTVYDQDIKVVALAFLAAEDYESAKEQAMTIARVTCGAQCEIRIHSDAAAVIAAFDVPARDSDNLEGLAARESLH